MPQKIEYENLIILLYLFNRTRMEAGRMSTAKLLYLYENELYNSRMIGSSYIMKRYQMGPYNTQIAVDIKNLANNGFLKVKEVYFDKINDFVDIYSKNLQNTKFLKSIEGLIQENAAIFDKLDIILDIYSRKNGEELKDYIYSLKNTGWKHQRIEDYWDRQIILNPKKVENPIHTFHIDEDWYDTIEILLDREQYYNLQRGIKHAQQGKFTNELI